MPKFAVVLAVLAGVALAGPAAALPYSGLGVTQHRVGATNFVKSPSPQGVASPRGELGAQKLTFHRSPVAGPRITSVVKPQRTRDATCRRVGQTLFCN